MTNVKRALRIPIIVYRWNLRLMEIQNKPTALSKMPLNIVHDENIEQHGISHEYYELKSGVENKSNLDISSFYFLYNKIRI